MYVYTNLRLCKSNYINYDGWGGGSFNINVKYLYSIDIKDKEDWKNIGDHFNIYL